MISKKKAWRERREGGGGGEGEGARGVVRIRKLALMERNGRFSDCAEWLSSADDCGVSC